MFLADNKKRYEQGLRKYDIPKLRPTNALITTREQADRYTRDSNKECYRILCSAFEGDTPYERRRKWEKQQRAAAKRKRDEEDDDDEDDNQGDWSGKRKKDDNPDYRPSKKQLKKADKRGDK